VILKQYHLGCLVGGLAASQSAQLSTTAAGG
jgi:hypothetical protein